MIVFFFFFCAYSNIVWLVEFKNNFNRLPVNCGVKTDISDFCFVALNFVWNRKETQIQKNFIGKYKEVPIDKESGLTSCRVMTFDIWIGDKTEIDKRNSVGLFILEFIMTSGLFTFQRDHYPKTVCKIGWMTWFFLYLYWTSQNKQNKLREAHRNAA